MKTIRTYMVWDNGKYQGLMSLTGLRWILGYDDEWHPMPIERDGTWIWSLILNKKRMIEVRDDAPHDQCQCAECKYGF